MSEKFRRVMLRLGRIALLVAIAWLCLVGLPSFPAFRSVLAQPLYIHQPDARGDAAYVMAGGYAFWERLHAASDLYHMQRVPKIYLLIEEIGARYDFVAGQAETQTQRAVRYLQWLGVPESAIGFITVDGKPSFGSLSEAKAFAKLDLPELKRLVVVTSAPHTRRSKLCFERNLPDVVQVQSFAASEMISSTELHEPLWIEYAKLFVYYFIA